MAKRLTPGQKAARTRAKNKARAEREAKRASKQAERERKAEEKARRDARGPCVCGKKHRDAYKYWECEQKLAKIECTCPPYWHRPNPKTGKRWLSHSYTHGCPLAEKGMEQARREYNLRTFGADLSDLSDL